MPDCGFSQVELVCGIMRVLSGLSPGLMAEPRIMNKLVDAANEIIKEIERDPVMAKEDMGLAAWLKSDDTGMSSKFMAHILVGGPPVENHYPLDPSDFGRCYRFLLAVPTARGNMHRLTKCGPVWDAYMKRWGDMEALWLKESPSGNAPLLYQFMTEIRDRVKAEKPKK